MQQRARAFVHVKTGAAHFYAALKINNAQRLAQIPVRLGRKIKLARLAPAAHFDVVVLVWPNGHAGAGHVRHPQLFVVEVSLNLAERFVQLADFVANFGHALFLGFGLGFFALTHQLADSLAAAVALLAQRLNLFEQVAPLLVQLQNLVDGRFGV